MAHRRLTQLCSNRLGTLPYVTLPFLVHTWTNWNPPSVD
jgi:hypothetical protein